MVKFTSIWNFLLEYTLKPLEYRACISPMQAPKYTQNMSNLRTFLTPPLIPLPLKSDVLVKGYSNPLRSCLVGTPAEL